MGAPLDLGSADPQLVGAFQGRAALAADDRVAVAAFQRTRRGVAPWAVHRLGCLPLLGHVLYYIRTVE